MAIEKSQLALLSIQCVARQVVHASQALWLRWTKGVGVE